MKDIFSQEVVIGTRGNWSIYYYFKVSGSGFYLMYRNDDYSTISGYGIEHELDKTIRETSHGIDYKDNPRLPWDIEQDVIWLIFDGGIFK
jgi:hypothetical protein